MKSIASSPRNSWKGQEEETASGLSIVPRVMRPLAVIAALLVMALVILPTAGVAVAGDRYNDNDDDDDDDDGGNNVVKIALIVAAVGALVYFTSNAGDDDDDNGMVNQ